MNQFPDWSQFADPKPLECRDGQVPLRKELDKYLRVSVLAVLQAFPERPAAFYKGNCTPGEVTIRLPRVYWILDLN